MFNGPRSNAAAEVQMRAALQKGSHANSEATTTNYVICHLRTGSVRPTTALPKRRNMREYSERGE